nr:MAG TPA: hypothetical protein [Bacteriophage sp.]
MEELEKNETSTQAEENTVSLASAQALADALAKIEVYTPTTWVDNSSPDIDAEHLNKPEQAIKRVTDALNSAVDVIKDLQSQITKNSGAISDVNNNLGNGVFKALTFSDFSTSDDIKLVCQKMFSALPTSGVCYRVRMKPTPSGTTTDAYVYCASSNYGFVHIRDHGGTDYYGRVQNGTWTWDSYALKSDLDLKLNNTSFFVGNGKDFGQAIKKAGIVQLNRVGFFICNNPSNSPLGNGLIILTHNEGYWNNHPMYIQTNGNSISCGTLNCSDYTHITKD